MDIRSVTPAPLRSAARTVLAPRIRRRSWEKRGFAMPAPIDVKWDVLRRYGRPNSTWIETGTFLGDTTAFLARSAKMVYSIEPSEMLSAKARARFHGVANVTIIRALSEDVLDDLIASVDGPLSLWLDGHYSAGITHKGPQDTPIREELATVERHLGRFPDISVLVDDVRCFDPAIPEYASYPSRTWLVEWADRNGLAWAIEHDIFVATRGRGAS